MRNARPTGIVTFLFTDIEGSTQLWERAPEPMKIALARHDTILHEIVATHGGHVFKTMGDAFCAAFQTPLAALETALAAQRALLAESWLTPTPIRVRMALHTGMAEERDDDYFGPVLNRVARLLAAGHGGQTLLSKATMELIRDKLPPGMTLRDLDQRRLKDLFRPEQIYQVVAPDLPAEFPPLRTLDVAKTNLPAQPTPFIGREHELAAVLDLLRRADTRLVTLTGPGGTGKTRLALQTAADLLDEYPQGVYFVDLSPVRDPDLALSSIADALGVKEEGDKSLIDTLADFLRDKHMLLALDNFEQVIAVAPVLRDLMTAAPHLKILVTSREALRVYGEHTYPVPPLGVPELRRGETVAVLVQYEAVRLFVQRAKAARPDFALTETNAPAIAEICVRLDGLPLAIELAAARTRALPPDAMLDRLASRLRTLTGGARDLPARQQTLRGAIDWSYELLDTDQQTLFARLGVFMGGWTLVEAEAICNAAGDLPFDVFDGLESLLDKSLLRLVDSASGDTRFTMLETIREYAAERLAEQPDVAALRERHARCFMKFVEDPEFFDAHDAYHRAAEAHDNLRAALGWSLSSGQPDVALRIGTALWMFWTYAGHLREGLRWLENALAVGTDVPPHIRANALRAAGNLVPVADYQQARVRYEEALALYRTLEDTRGIGSCLNNLANLAVEGDRDYASGQALYEESITLARSRGDTQSEAKYLTNLGLTHMHSGDLALARANLEAAAALSREAGYAITGWVLASLGMIATRQGDFTQARASLHESLIRGRDYGDSVVIIDALKLLAYLALAERQPARAARLIGAVDTLGQGLDIDQTSFELEEYKSAVAALRAALGDEAYESEHLAGQAMTVEEAVAYALTIPV